MGMFDSLWATDENLFTRAQADFAALATRSETIARGTDGVIGSAARWRLTTAGSLDWAAAGVVPGHVVQVEWTDVGGTVRREAFAVDAVATTSLDLRRPGLGPGEGLPPGPTAGTTTGVKYKIESLRPGLVTATTLLGRRFAGLAADASGPAAADRTELAAAWTLWRAFADAEPKSANLATAITTSVNAADGNFAGKAKFWKAVYDQLVGLIDARYASVDSESGPRIVAGLLRLNPSGRRTPAAADG